jgi:hypothetical protein
MEPSFRVDELSQVESLRLLAGARVGRVVYVSRWVGGSRECYVRIVPSVVTGRRLVPIETEAVGISSGVCSPAGEEEDH